MSTAPALTRGRRPPVGLAVAAGVQAACCVGALALMTAGHGIAGWGLLMAGGAAVAVTNLRWLTWDRARRRTWRGTSRAVGGMVLLTMLVLIGGGGLAARALAVDHPWLATVVTVAVGVVFGVLARWWHRRLTPHDA